MAELLTERIRRNARELKLYGLDESADSLVERAERGKLGYREFLDLVLEDEVSVLEGRRYASRLKLSAVPHRKTLDEFDVGFQPDLDPKRLRELRTLRFIERRVSLLVFGPPGVGKSHIAVGLAMDALRRGYLVRYTTLDELVRSLREADALGKLKPKLSHLQRRSTARTPTASFRSSTDATRAARRSSPRTSRPRSGPSCSATRCSLRRSSIVSCTTPRCSRSMGPPTGSRGGSKS
jgi:hypothetical protein